MAMSDIDKTLCDEAISIVTGARREAYDKPERNFKRIALAWEAITDRPYTELEVALMFVQLKLVRQSHAQQRDNIVDGIGYLLCADAVTAKTDCGACEDGWSDSAEHACNDNQAQHPAATPFKEQFEPNTGRPSPYRDNSPFTTDGWKPGTALDFGADRR